MAACPLCILGLTEEEHTAERWASITPEERLIISARWRRDSGADTDPEAVGEPGGTHKMTTHTYPEGFILSDDRKFITYERDVAAGIMVSRLKSGRPEGFTDEEITYFLEHASEVSNPNKVGQHLTMKRKPTKRGAWYVFHTSGPPVWWVPRIIPTKWGLLVGWFTHGYGLEWVRGEK